MTALLRGITIRMAFMLAWLPPASSLRRAVDRIDANSATRTSCLTMRSPLRHAPFTQTLKACEQAIFRLFKF
jgi:hypothetical protein